jgi:hypothetical protein
MSLKNEIILLAQAHLKNVEGLLSDLNKQKDNISQEIFKLENYLQLGAENIQKFSEE